MSHLAEKLSADVIIEEAVCKSVGGIRERGSSLDWVGKYVSESKAQQKKNYWSKRQSMMERC